MCDTTLAIRGWIERNGKYTPAQVAAKLGYDRKDILILDNDWDSLKQEFPEYWDTICSNKHQADKRTPEKWAETMTLNWLLEDIILATIKRMGIDCERQGVDKERTLLKSNNVIGNPDFVIHMDGRDVNIEMNMNANDYWKSTGTMDLRDNKYNNLVNNGSLLLSICLNDSTFTILEPSIIPHSYNFIQNFGKMGTTLDIRGVPWMSLSGRNLKDAILQYAGN